jgi:hypothetical protein
VTRRPEIEKTYFVVVVVIVGLHFAFLLYLPSGGLLAILWPRTVWLHVPTGLWGLGIVRLRFPCPLRSWRRASSVCTSSLSTRGSSQSSGGTGWRVTYSSLRMSIDVLCHSPQRAQVDLMAALGQLRQKRGEWI